MARMTVRLPDDVEEMLNRVSQEKGVSKVDLIRRAFTVFKVAEEEQKKGNFLAIAKAGSDDGNPQVVAKIVGI